jgi:hypothetical protein
MERDFRKLTEWLEETLQAGVVEENRVLEWKLAEKARLESSSIESSERAKTS